MPADQPALPFDDPPAAAPPGVRHTLAIDPGEKYFGVALVRHTAAEPNRPVVAYTLTVAAKPLTQAVERRAGRRRLRRTRKTHRRRLRRLEQAVRSVGGPAADDFAPPLLAFCRRRGFGYPGDPPDDAGEDGEGEDGEDVGGGADHVAREAFFEALEGEVARIVPPDRAAAVLAACERHLNRARNPLAELRPARFDNRGRSRCRWGDCRRNTPRTKNAPRPPLRRALLGWLRPALDAHPRAVADGAAEPDAADRLLKSAEWAVDRWLAAAKLSARAADDADPKPARKQATAIRKQVGAVLKDRVARAAPGEPADRFAEHWTKYYRKNLSDLAANPTGRNRFCREHADAYVERLLSGERLPDPAPVAAGDLPGRKSQILFDRVARLVESRMLPAAGGAIDRIVVERVAFDLLRGPLKQRQAAEKRGTADDLYQNGPAAGYDGTAAMLKAEFAGRCVYCGAERPGMEVEHLLPRSRFPFDSYLNLVPACGACNARKGNRTPAEAGMTVHEDAAAAYAAHVAGRPVRHPYHDVKKGLLKMLTRPGGAAADAERLVGMIASNLLSATAAQRSPRPLARYLLGRLPGPGGGRPRVEHVAARHAALFRSVALPGYDKPADKAAGRTVNHAVDAIVLGCEAPSAAAMENVDWGGAAERFRAWRERAAAAAPPAGEGGVPELLRDPAVPPAVEFFEEEDARGYRTVELAAFNWNRRRQSWMKDTVYGHTAAAEEASPYPGGTPLIRKPLADLLVAFVPPAGKPPKPGEPEKVAAAIAHAALRGRVLSALEANGPRAAAEALLCWNQDRTRDGLRGGAETAHPSDRARRADLRRFVRTPAADFLREDDPAAVPPAVGVRIYAVGSRGKNPLARDLPGRPAAQRMQEDGKAFLVVGYPRDAAGAVRDDKPVRLTVSHSGAVTVNGPVFGEAAKAAKAEAAAGFAPGHPLAGCPFGDPDRTRVAGADWGAAFADLCGRLGLARVIRLSQGCVVERRDGSRFQLRNFQGGKPWTATANLSGIRRVLRSPLST